MLGPRHALAGFDLRQLRPRVVVGIALVLAFFAFWALHFANNYTVAGLLGNPGMAPFVRGFVAFAVGMAVVLWVMHRKEEELIRLRAQFSERLVEREQQVEILSYERKQDLRKQNSALLAQREDFLAVISHRLRTPILASNRILSLMLDGDFGTLSQSHQEILSHLLDNNNELERLLGMLVDIYRYRNGKKDMTMAPHNLVSIAYDVAGQYGGIAASKKIQLSIENSFSSATPLILCDRLEIFKLITHLVENALKYGGSKVTVGIKAEGANNVELFVEDDGPGIAPDDVANLFDRFYLTSTGGKHAPATGTGLCLCYEIARAHGGSISCHSTPGAGTKFEMIIPLTSVAAA
jgi:signal transduction histidine kinase